MRWVIAVCLLAATPAYGAEIVRAGPGCTDRDLAEDLYVLRDVKHDIRSFGEKADDGVRLGLCRFFKIGAKVEVESPGVVDLACVKQDSDEACFWVLPSMVQP